MNVAGDKGRLEIKKYPNRRFYDATRSRHLTLQDVHDAVAEGHDVTISDSRSGQNITNLILTQILLEKSPPKLEILPSWTLHQLIRSNEHVLRSSVDRFLGPFASTLAASQKQFESYMRRATAGQFMSPLEWAREMMQAFTPSGEATEAEQEDAPPDAPPDPDAAPQERDEQVDELRRQLAELTSKIDSLSSTGRPNKPQR